MKTYLAGAEVVEYARILTALRYPYRLCSYYNLLDKADEARREVLALAAADDGAQWIMDSGLFTFMFGSDKGKLTTFEDYLEYATRYVATAHQWGWKHALVECDVQRVLGVDETHKLREQVFDNCGLEVIYVWHIPEGEDGLRKLAATKSRIALSVPELRQVLGTGPSGGMKVRSALVHLLRICREAGPARVHLLGNTEAELMKLPADSSDSTSWEAGRFGDGYLYTSGTIKGASIYSAKWLAWEQWCKDEWPTEMLRIGEQCKTVAQQRYLTAAACSALGFYMFMEAHDGK